MDQCQRHENRSFPKVEITVGGVQTRTPGGRGEYTEYRIVNYEDQSGDIKETWAKIEFEMFRYVSTEWNPEP